MNNKFVYKFPTGNNKKNFTNVEINVKPWQISTEVESSNIKFCYSSSVGMAIDISFENCFLTGNNIPYSLTFINPLILPKNYKTYSDNYYVTLSPYYSSEYILLDIKENKYETMNRNIEGVGKILKIDNDDNMISTILTLPEIITNNNTILIQMQLCSSSQSSINYNTINAYTQDEIDYSSLNKKDKLYIKIINNLMETEIKFIGNNNDVIFIKHIGLNNYKIHLENYFAVFDENQNTVIINKPILDEAFRITVLIGKKGRFNDFTLCSFAEKEESQYKYLGDYVNTFTSITSNVIIHYIDFKSFGYSEGDEFDLLIYAVQINNSKLEILYDIITGKVGKVQGVNEIENYIDANYVSQSFIRNTISNYLFYDFVRMPAGNVASLTIMPESNYEENIKINKIGCTFVKKYFTDEEMIREVNKAMIEGRNYCIGEYNKY